MIIEAIEYYEFDIFVAVTTREPKTDSQKSWFKYVQRINFGTPKLPPQRHESQKYDKNK